MSTETKTHETNSSTHDTALLTGNSHDGILLYDNPVPSWWKFFFVAGVVLGVLSFLYHVSGQKGLSVEEQYRNHLSSVLGASV